MQEFLRIYTKRWSCLQMTENYIKLCLDIRLFNKHCFELISVMFLSHADLAESRGSSLSNELFFTRVFFPFSSVYELLMHSSTSSKLLADVSMI